MKTQNIHGRINQRANQKNFMIQQFSCGLGENVNNRAKRLSLFENSFDPINEEPIYSELRIYHTIRGCFNLYN